MTMRILFAGTPEIALFSLDALEQAGRLPVAVLTNTDAPQGRKRTLVAPPVKQWAAARNIPVLQPERLDTSARQAVRALQPEILVTVAYGRIFGPRFLDLFSSGGINLHPSLLPRHRGPSPIQAAILAGDARTGVSVQRLALEMDAGDVLASREVALTGTETARELHDALGALGATLLVRVVQEIEEGREHGTPQRADGVTHCSLITRDDGALDWSESAVQIDRMVRALTPWPGVRCRWNGTELHLTRTSLLPATMDDTPGVPATPGTVTGVDRTRGILIQTGSGIICVSRLKLQARREMDFLSFLNGNSTIIGSVLEQA